MSFTVPEMPLTAGIWTVQPDATILLRVMSPCNVAFGRRVTTVDVAFNQGFGASSAYLLFPAGTDVRDDAMAGNNLADEVEVPLGSGRWYHVLYVNDLGQGFSNEHRFAVCEKSTNIVLWPAPLPPVWEAPELVVRRVGDILLRGGEAGAARSRRGPLFPP